MIQMTRDQLLDELSKFDDLPNPSRDYGLTEQDVEKLEANPEKYLDFVIYLLSRDCYRNPSQEYVFINEDAMKPVDVSFRLNELISGYIQLTD